MRIEKIDTNINVHITGGSVTLPHMHDCLELAYVLEGKAVHKIGNSEEHIISEGDFFIIDYRTVHSYKGFKNMPFKVINCLFTPEFIDKSLAYCKDFQTLLRHYLLQISTEYSALNMADRIFHDDEGRILELLKQMLAEYDGKNIGRDEILRCKMIEVLIITARMLSAEKNSDIITDIVERMHQNYDKELTLSSLIHEMNYSLPYISKLFKEKTGMGFRTYLQKIRIKEACRMLVNCDDKIWSISNAVGYSDIDFFCKKFKEVIGTTPSDFRKKFKNESREI